jgi:hypothetical protein
MLLEFVYEEEKRRANIASISTAKLALVVVNVAQALAGSKKEAKLTLDELLPFVLNEEVAAKQTETEEILNKVIRERKLPVHVVAALSKVTSI